MKTILGYIKRTLLAALCLFALNICVAQESITTSRPGTRTVPDTVAERMKLEKEFRYANDPAYWTDEKPREDSAVLNIIDAIARSRILKYALYTFLALVVIFAIYQVMVVNDFFIFSKPGKKKQRTETEDESLTADDLDDKINAAITAGEYRSAIRYMYLKTLQVLNEKQLIQLHSKATNRDYITQMQKHSLGAEFSKLTRIYEFVWYGEFQPSEYQFTVISNNFKRFIAND